LGKLITVVGNSGVGKTTFVQQLCLNPGFIQALEKLEERPFQELFSLNKKSYALANQIDFLIYRAEQEIEIRNGEFNGVQDGGLEEDFYLFTLLFHQKGYITDSEYDICERVYSLLRGLLPPPDLIVWLQAPIPIIAERFKHRDRRLGIATIEELEAMELLLVEWLQDQDLPPIIIIDTTCEDSSYSKSIKKVFKEIDRLA
jgi:deoxyadenosine/deoxycytidine kinase